MGKTVQKENKHIVANYEKLQHATFNSKRCGNNVRRQSEVFQATKFAKNKVKDDILLELMLQA